MVFRFEGRWLDRWLSPAFVAAVCAASVALAYASPPDPSWVEGIYDDHDHDDVVVLLTDGAGASDSPAPRQVEHTLVEFVLQAAKDRIASPTPTGWTARGPPIRAQADRLLTHAANSLSPPEFPPTSCSVSIATRSSVFLEAVS